MKLKGIIGIISMNSHNVNSQRLCHNFLSLRLYIGEYRPNFEKKGMVGSLNTSENIILISTKEFSCMLHY